MFYAELLKLKRAQLWVVTCILPLLSVVIGTGNTTANSALISQTWEGLESQITIFYGLFFCSVGVAVLVAAGWRMEHQGNNWSQVHTMTSNYFNFMVAKILVLCLPIFAMNFVLLLGTAIAGKLMLHLAGFPSMGFILAMVLATVAAAPLVALQSIFSMWLRSFAAPVGIALFGTIFAYSVMQKSLLITLVVPYSLLSHSVLMGSLAVSDSTPVNAQNIAQAFGVAIVVTILLALIGSFALRWRKTLKQAG